MKFVYRDRFAQFLLSSQDYIFLNCHCAYLAIDLMRAVDWFLFINPV